MHWPIYALACVLWTAAALLAAVRLRPTLAVALIFVSGYALLPVARELEFPIKSALTSGMGLVALILAVRRGGLKLPRAGWWDIPIALWTALQMASEWGNNRPLADAGNVLATQLALWVIPWCVGRAVLRTYADFADAASVLVGAALALVPLAVYECVGQPYAPALHTFFYGSSLISSNAHFPLILNRWGPDLYRQSLFFDTGELATGFFFAAAALVQGWWCAAGGGLWRSRGLNLAVFLMLLAAAVNARVLAAVLLLVVGAAMLSTAGLLRWKHLFFVLLAALPAYILIRATGLLRTPFLVADNSPDILGKNYSIWFRMYEQDVVLEYIKNAPLLGYGSKVKLLWQNTGLPRLEWVDSYWTWVLIRNGWLGLCMAVETLLIPLGAVILTLPGRKLRTAEIAPAAALLVVLLLHAADDTMNQNLAPLWGALLGGMASLAFCKPLEIDILEARPTEPGRA